MILMARTHCFASNTPTSILPCRLTGKTRAFEALNEGSSPYKALGMVDADIAKETYGQGVI